MFLRLHDISKNKQNVFKFICTLLFISGGFAISLPLSAADKPHVVYGKVLRDGVPVKDVPVALLKFLPNPQGGPPMSPVGRTQTDTDGAYRFELTDVKPDDRFTVGILLDGNRTSGEPFTFGADTQKEVSFQVAGTVTDPSFYTPVRTSFAVTYMGKERTLRITDYTLYRNSSGKTLDLRGTPITYPDAADTAEFKDGQIHLSLYTDTESGQIIYEYDFTQDVRPGMTIELPVKAGTAETLDAEFAGAVAPEMPGEEGKTDYAVRTLKADTGTDIRQNYRQSPASKAGDHCSLHCDAVATINCRPAMKTNLPIISRIIDDYYLTGSAQARMPCLNSYIRFISALEKYLLNRFRHDAEKTGDSASGAQEFMQTYFYRELRHKHGTVRLFQEFRTELCSYLAERPSLAKDAWQSYIAILISHSAYIPANAGHPPPVFRFLLSLLSADPRDLFELFDTGDNRSPDAETALDITAEPLTHPLKQHFDTYFEDMNADRLWAALREFYRTSSGGDLLLFSAFEPIAHSRDGFVLRGIPGHQMQTPKPLYGIDEHYRQLKDNMELFISGKPARHVLLWGYRGTGKSSCVLKLAQEFFVRGVRLVDFPASRIADISACFELLGRYRERFIVFLDDLSFENGDVSYKLLKTRLEGSVRRGMHNIILHATSNRRELADAPAATDERSDYPQVLDEKRAIDDRFGLKLFFDFPVPEDLKALLYRIADEYGISGDKETLHQEFSRFCMFNRYTSPGGRAVRRFLDTRLSS
ncbi:hypothetical protein CHS0354_018474 [Potamilus streckersoni]|uniref:AAA+ ATPase domain-containing protein n=1 Tax=Potamilus streckersoni TaxID=2493646 RepID=A0AAE0TBN2_9BIVA|nr:hypothetical protein CHS0354_018474 [Potamilus streckersoni]